MRAYARRKQCKDSQKLNGYKKLPCILRENVDIKKGATPCSNLC